MPRPVLFTERTLYLATALIMALIVALIPLMGLTEAETRALVVWVLASTPAILALIWMQARWGRSRLAPITVPLLSLLTTLLVAILLRAVSSAWVFYFVLPLIAALIYDLEWTYLSGALAALGYLAVVIWNGSFYAEADDALLAISTLLIFALIAGRLSASERRRAREQEALNTLAFALNRSLTLDDVLETAAAQIQTAARVDAVELFTIQAETLVLRVQRGLSPEFVAGIRDLKVGEGITGRVAQRGEVEVLTAGLRRDPRLTREVVRRSNFEALVSVPLKAQARVVGVMNLALRRPRAFDADDLAFFAALGEYLATAITNARLYDESSDRTRRLALLNQFAALVNRGLDLQTLLADALRLAADLLHLETAWVAIFDESSGQFALTAEHNLPPALTADDKHLMRRGICSCQRLLLDGKMPAAVNILACERFAGAGITALHASVPLKSGDRALGILNAVKPSGEAFTPDDLVTLGAMGAQLGVALERARLHEQVKEWRLREQAALLKLSQSLVSVVEPEAVLDQAAATVMEIFNPALVSIMLPDARGENLVLRAGRGWERELYGAYGVDVATSREGHAFRTGEAVWVDDVLGSTRFACPPALRARGVHSSLTAPFNGERGTLGTLCAHFREPRAFSHDDARRLALVAAQAALAYERVQLHVHARQRLQRISALHDIDVAIASEVELEARLNILLEKVTDHLSVDAAAIALIDAETRELNYAARRGLNGEFFRDGLLRVAEGVAGQVAATGELRAIEDVSQESLFVRRAIAQQLGIVSYLAVPLHVRGAVIGVLELATRARHTFPPEEIDFFVTLAGQAAVALENARLFQETRWRATELAALNGVTTAINQSLELDEILRIALDRTLEIVECEAGEIFLLDAPTQDLVMAMHCGVLDQPLLEKMRFKLGEGYPGIVASTGQSLVTDAMLEDPRFLRRRVIAAGFNSCACVPLRVKGQSVGMLDVMTRRTHTFTARDVRLLEAMAEQVAVAIENARLFASVRAQLTRTQTLQAMGALLTAQLGLDEVLETILDLLSRVVQYDSVSIQLIDADNRLNLAAARGFPNLEEIRAVVRELSEQVLERQWTEHRAIVIPDTHADRRWVVAPENEYIRSWIGAPLFSKERLIGILNVDSRTVNVYDEPAGEIVMAFADQAAVAIENARLFQETQRRADEFAALYAMAHDLGAQQDLPTILQTVVARAVTLLGAPSGFIYLYHAPTGSSTAQSEVELTVAQGYPLPLGTRMRLGEGMAGTVAQTLQPLIVDDYRTSKYRLPQLSGGPFTAVVEAPMLYSGELIGVLGVCELAPSPTGSSTTRKYTEDDARLLTLFAAQAASAVHNARLFEETQKRAEQLAALYQIGQTLNSTLDAEAILARVIDEAMRVGGAHYGCVVVVDEAAQRFVFRALRGYSPGLVQEAMTVPMALTEGLNGRAYRTRQIVLVEDTRQAPDYRAAVPETRAELVVPIIHGGRFIGNIDLQDPRVGAFRHVDLGFFQALADQAAVALANAQLFETASQAERRYRNLFEEAPLMYVITRNEGGIPIIADCNESFLTALGYTRAEVVGCSLTELYTLESRARALEGGGYQHALEGAFVEERGFVTRDGRLIETLLRASPEVDAAGRVIGTRAMFVDITQRKRAEEELRRRVKELALINQISAAINQPLTLTDVLTSTLRELTGLLRLDRGAVAVMAETRDYLTIIAEFNPAGGASGINESPTAERIASALNQTIPLHGNPAMDYILRQRQPLAIADVARDPRFASALALPRALGVQAMLLLPLIVQERVIGTIGLDSTQGKRVFTPEEIALAQTITNHAAAAIEKARLFETERAAREQAETLRQVAESLGASLELDDVLRLILEQLKRILTYDTASVLLFGEGNQSTLVSSIGYADPKLNSEIAGDVLKDSPILAQMAQDLRPVIIPDVREQAGWIWVPGAEHVRAFLAVPIVRHGGMSGVLMADSTTLGFFKEADAHVAQALAQHMAVAIENARLYEEAKRRAREQSIVSEIARALNASLDVKQAFPTIVDGLRELTGGERVSLALLDEVQDPVGDNVHFTLVMLDRPRVEDPVGAELAEGTRLPIGASSASADVLAGRSHLTADLGTALEYPAERMAYEAGLRARVALPLIVGERVIGALNVSSRAVGKFSPSQLPVLEQIAGTVAIAIQNSWLFEAEQTRRAELGTLYELSRALADTNDFETILDLIARRAVETIHITFARVVLVEGDEFVVRAAYPARVLGHDMDVGRRDAVQTLPVYQRMAHQDAPLVLQHDEPALSEVERAALLLDVARTLCLVPLRVGTRASKIPQGLGILMLGEVRRREREPFTAEKIRLARSIGDQAASALHRAELFAQLEETYLQTVLALANAVDAKDTYTAGHAKNLAVMALAVGRALGLNPRELEDLRYGAILHDIGKIGIPDAILKKPARLEADEWREMRRHPEIGAQILAPVPRLRGAARIVRHHHERYDGAGYPDGLAGEAIPLGARILTVVDTYGAILDARVYKAARTQEEAVTELRRHAGAQFDPQVVEIFLRVVE